MNVEERIRELLENEARSCSLDFGCIMLEYVYRMLGCAISVEEIEKALPIALSSYRDRT